MGCFYAHINNQLSAERAVPVRVRSRIVRVTSCEATITAVVQVVPRPRGTNTGRCRVHVEASSTCTPYIPIDLSKSYLFTQVWTQYIKGHSPLLYPGLRRDTIHPFYPAKPGAPSEPCQVEDVVEKFELRAARPQSPPLFKGHQDHAARTPDDAGCT